MRPLSPAVLFLSVHAMAADVDWPVYLGDAASTQYSALSQITPENVATLETAWVYRSGGADPQNRSQIQCNPLIIGGTLFGTSADFQLFALDAGTGRERWRFDPAKDGFPKGGVNRGLAYWGRGEEARIFYGNERFLHAIDPRSGRRIPSFGNQGSIDLRDSLGRESSDQYLTANTPGIVFRDRIIMGMRLGEGPGPAAPGAIRAYDVRTGALVWRFDTIPQPGQAGYESWPPDAYRRIGGANVWTGFALDEARGLVFCPTGSAAFDFWGGNRTGANLYANCLIALNAATGERVWHFQFVHHDLWDRDLPAPPNLVTVTMEGRKVDAVAQVTKSGHVFVFDRVTGEPLFPVEEVAVPPSTLAGESAWPTQPLPRKPAPFARQVFSYEQITDLTPAAHRAVLDRFARLKPHVPFAPPSEEGTIIFPGFDGGAEWGGAAADPEGVLYVNANEMPWVLTMVPMKGQGPAASGASLYAQLCAACHGIDRRGNAAQNVPSLIDLDQRMQKQDVVRLLGEGRGVMPSFAFLDEARRAALADELFGKAAAVPPDDAAQVQDVIPFTSTGYHRWLDPQGYPAVKPPWGTLHAIDLNTGEYRWSVPLGEYPELTARGVPQTGTENYGGPVVTAGGLVFIAASRDQTIRAFDRGSGRELWRAPLPAGGYATPATYSVGGRQYVVIACGGGKMGTPSGDAYVAFALPE